MADCDCEIDSIERECGKNAAGIKPTVAITCEDEVVSIGAAVDHAVSAMTLRAAGSGITAGYFRKWRGSRKDLDFKSDQDPESGIWKTEWKLFIPKQKASKAVILNNLGEDNNIVVVTDMNGAQRIVGEIDNPCNVTSAEQTNPKNGYAVTGTWESAYSPYFFTGTLDTTP